MKKITATLLLLLALLPANAQQRHSDGLDDVLQHVPMVTVLAMRALEELPDGKSGWTKANTSWTELLATAAASYTLSAATTYALKHACHEQRPDKSDRRSLPSGHATMAFSGATVLMHEYGSLSPWVTVGGYTLATLVAVDRVLRDRHYVHDVVAGAAIGIGATELTYLLKRKLIKNRNIDVSLTGLGFELTVSY